MVVLSTLQCMKCLFTRHCNICKLAGKGARDEGTRMCRAQEQGGQEPKAGGPRGRGRGTLLHIDLLARDGGLHVRALGRALCLIQPMHRIPVVGDERQIQSLGKMQAQLFAHIAQRQPASIRWCQIYTENDISSTGFH